MKTRALLWAIGLLSIAVAGCGSVHRGHLLPLPDEDTTFLKSARGVAVRKGGVAVVVAPINEVKEADAFYVVLFNQSGQWVNFRPSDVYMLDENMNRIEQLSRADRNFLLGARHVERPPAGIKADVFRWDRRLNVQGEWAAPLNPDAVVRTSVMSGGKRPFFVYFRKRSTKSPRLMLVVPGVQLGTTMEEHTFQFRFEVQKG
jgi:hypothetical protein